MTNWYAPSKVTTHKMTNEEKKRYAPESQKYPWRKSRQWEYDANTMVAENASRIYTATYKLKTYRK